MASRSMAMDGVAGRAGTIERMYRVRKLLQLPRTPGLIVIMGLAGALVGCQPTVKVEAPKEPITINLNIKLDADVRVKLEKQAEQDINANPDIF